MPMWWRPSKPGVIMDGSDKKFRPQLFSSADNPNMQYWFCEGKSIGFRPPTLTEQELIALSKETGRELEYRRRRARAARCRVALGAYGQARHRRPGALQYHVDRSGRRQGRSRNRPVRFMEPLDGRHVEGRQKPPALVLRRAGDDAQRSHAADALRQSRTAPSR